MNLLLPLALSVAIGLLGVMFYRACEKAVAPDPIEVEPLALGVRVAVWIVFACGCEREASIPYASYMTGIVQARCPAHGRPVVGTELAA